MIQYAVKFHRHRPQIAMFFRQFTSSQTRHGEQGDKTGRQGSNGSEGVDHRETRLETVAIMQVDKAGSQDSSGSEGGDHEGGQDWETKRLQRQFLAIRIPYIEK